MKRFTSEVAKATMKKFGFTLGHSGYGSWSDVDHPSMRYGCAVTLLTLHHTQDLMKARELIRSSNKLPERLVVLLAPKVGYSVSYLLGLENAYEGYDDTDMIADEDYNAGYEDGSAVRALVSS